MSDAKKAVLGALTGLGIVQSLFVPKPLAERSPEMLGEYHQQEMEQRAANASYLAALDNVAKSAGDQTSDK